MDRAEAKDILDYDIRQYIKQCEDATDEDFEALDLAIEALKKVSVYEQVKWERDWALKTLEEHGLSLGQIVEPKEKHQLSGETPTISEKESVEGDAESTTTTDCNDCIWNTCNYNKIDWDLEVSEDCISRADLIESFLADNECKREEAKACMCSLDFMLELIEDAPPVTPTEQNEEDILKFYYVESLDEYWIGQRCGTRYYGKWTGNCFTFGYSRYLPWGEHVVAPDTLWKEHTYPSEPKEIPFNEWLQGFLQKEYQTERTGEWIPVKKVYITNDVDFPYTHIEWETATDPDDIDAVRCSECGEVFDFEDARNWCTECGAKMKGGAENE